MSSIKVNYHTHSNFCDGKGKPKDYVLEAIKRGFSSLGFSSHAPLKDINDWTITDLDSLKEYLLEIETLKYQFKDKLTIHTGLEIDYYPNDNRFEYFKKYNIDYSIGSVHLLYAKNKNTFRCIDEGYTYFISILKEDFNSSIKDLVKSYYKALREMICQGGFNIIGHFDVVKKFNKNDLFFSEKEPWYINEVMKTLELIANRKFILEVNTKGIPKMGATYPSKWILEECYKMGIKICLNSDAHAPQKIEFCFSEILCILREVGYKNLHTPFEIINIEV